MDAKQKLTSFLTNKSILITGGTGSLGKELIKNLINLNPEKIVAFARDEDKLRLLLETYKNNPKVKGFLGDIRDRATIRKCLRSHNINLVIHAAALKQIVLCEEYPTEAIKTNINGCINLIEEIIDYGKIIKVIAVSTDKASSPINLYGMTKAAQERLIIEANKNSSTRFINVRYGNVTMSRGSFIPILIDNIKNNLPIKITHEDMTRFLLSYQDAIEVIYDALLGGFGGDTIIPILNSTTIVNLAKVIFMRLRPNEEFKYNISAIRPGEKIHECLISDAEEHYAKYEEMDFAKRIIVAPMINGFWSTPNPLIGLNYYSGSPDYLIAIERLQQFLTNII